MDIKNTIQGNPNSSHKKYTYLDLYNCVNECIRLIKNSEYYNQVGKPCFFIVDRKMESIAEFISLIELGFKPIPINNTIMFNNFYETNDKNLHEEILYKIIPSLVRNSNGEFELSDKILLHCDYLSKNNRKKEVLLNYNNELYATLYNNVDINQLSKDDNKFDFALLTSGTTGKSKVIKLNEDKLLENIFKKYNLSNEEIYACNSPISSISGIIFEIYLPIIGQNKCTSIGLLPYDLKNKPINVISPGNFNFNYSSIQPSGHVREDLNIVQMTTFGSKISEIIVFDLQTFKKNQGCSVVNYYGRTENYGLISQIEIDDMKPIHLYYGKISEDKIIYGYSLEDVYELKVENNLIVKTKLDMKFNYPDSLLMETFYPIAILNNPSEDIKINGQLFGEIIADGLKTGDYGIIIDDKIYLIGRKSDFIKNGNNSYCYIEPLDHKYETYNYGSNFYDETKFRCIGWKNLCYFVNEGSSVKIYIASDWINDYSDGNYYKILKFNKKLYEIRDKYNIEISDIIICKNDTVESLFENSKVKKNRLLNLKNVCNSNEINEKKDILKMVIRVLEKKYHYDPKIEYNEESRHYIFNKSHFSLERIIQVLKTFRVFDFKEDDNNYYLAISDDFLFATYEDDIENEDDVDYEKLIKENKIREYLLRKNNLLRKMKYTISYKYNEKNNLEAMIHNSDLYPFYKDEYQEELHKTINFTDDYEVFDEEVNIYESIKMNYDHCIGPECFSIDDDNNFYYYSKKITFDHTTPDIYKRIYELLLKHREKLRNEAKQLKKK